MSSALRSRARQSVLDAVTALNLDRVARRVERKGYVRVLNLHGTAARDRQRLRELVAWTREHFDVLSPSAFLALVGDSVTSYDRAGVVFTFDDGLRSNYDVAAPVLEEQGVHAFFFVNPAFALAPPAEHRAFFAAHIRDGTTSDRETPEDYTPMAPAEIAELVARGHVVGSHTDSHTNLGGLPERDYEREIVRPAAFLREWTGVPCESFAWTFAWDAISVAAWQCVARTYRVCFSACPSKNWVGRIDAQLIFRTNVEASLSPRQYAFFLSGLADPLWASRRRALVRMKAAVDGAR